MLFAADDMDELVHAVKHAIQQCGLQVCYLFHGMQPILFFTYKSSASPESNKS